MRTLNAVLFALALALPVTAFAQSPTAPAPEIKTPQTQTAPDGAQPNQRRHGQHDANNTDRVRQNQSQCCDHGDNHEGNHRSDH